MASELEAALSCPLTKELFDDPVLVSDGYSYERRAIVCWLSTSNASPTTGAPLTSREYSQNLTLGRATKLFVQMTKRQVKPPPSDEVIQASVSRFERERILQLISASPSLQNLRSSLPSLVAASTVSASLSTTGTGSPSSSYIGRPPSPSSIPPSPTSIVPQSPFHASGSGSGIDRTSGSASTSTSLLPSVTTSVTQTSSGVIQVDAPQPPPSPRPDPSPSPRGGERADQQRSAALSSSYSTLPGLPPKSPRGFTGGWANPILPSNTATPDFPATRARRAVVADPAHQAAAAAAVASIEPPARSLSPPISASPRALRTVSPLRFPSNPPSVNQNAVPTIPGGDRPRAVSPLRIPSTHTSAAPVSTPGGRTANAAPAGGLSPRRSPRADTSWDDALKGSSLEDDWVRSDKRSITHWPDPDECHMIAKNMSLVAAPKEFMCEFAHASVTQLDGQIDMETRACPFFVSMILPKRAMLISAFHDSIVGLEHYHFIGDGEEVGPVLVSVEDSDAARIRAIVRRKVGDTRLWISSKKPKQDLVDAIPEIGGIKLEKIIDPSLSTTLADFEVKNLERKYKFGVLLCLPGQKEEDQWYQNTGTQDFDDFLAILGDKVPLKNWQRYAGGLSVKESTLTGTHSVYTSVNNLEIMYHVSTMLPFYPEDTQQLERKRHLGNDVCVVIFREEACTEPFNPSVIRSHFNHVFVVVQPDRSSGTLCYNLQVCRACLRTGDPLARCGRGVIKSGSVAPVSRCEMCVPSATKRFNIIVVNGERSAMLAPEFRNRSTQTRKGFFTHIINEERKK